ncbi:hypothetical protein Dimus_005408 [Dionaea muscipula]
MGKSIQKERIGPYEIFVKEFYAKMTVIHLKKKDIVKSKVRGVEIEFDHEKLATILGIHRNNGILRKRREGEDEGNRVDFGGRRSLMRQAVEGESGSGRSSMMLEEDARGSPKRSMRFSEMLHPIRFDEGQGHSESRPSGPTSREADFLKFQAEFERKRANKFHDELEKAKARKRTFSLTSPSPNQTPSLDFPYLTFPPEQLLY